MAASPRSHNSESPQLLEMTMPKSLHTAASLGQPSAASQASEDDNTTLTLLVSFLSPAHEVTNDLLRRGGSPRRRWTEQGHVREVEATAAGLSRELTGLLSDPTRLGHALDSLNSQTVLSRSGTAYALNEQAARAIRKELSAEQLSFWKRQACIVAYRAVPWKYLESRLVI